MRIIAFDIGDRRIGIAISDPTGLLATAERVLKRSSIAKDLTTLAAIVKEYQAEAVVIGMPLHLDGREGNQAQSVRRFAERLKQRLSVPVVYWDERLSTAGAQRLLIEAGLDYSERVTRLDAAAAAVILQSYLNYLRQQGVQAIDSKEDSNTSPR